MGLFSRKRDAQGLYTGDAPVSAPGIDGAAPSAYVARDPAATGGSYVPPAPDLAPPPVSDRPSTAVPSPPPQWQQQLAPGMAGGQAAADPAVRTAPAGPAVPAVPAAAPGPAVPAAPGHPARARPRRSASGCLFTVAVGIAVIAAGAVIAVRQLGPDGGAGASPGSGGHGSTVLPSPSVPSVPSVRIGEPVTVRYSGATLELTVLGATAQPGGSWPDARGSAGPQLVVEARIRRTDAGPDPVTVMGWDWNITAPGGPAVAGDIITGYQPDLTDPSLAPGQSARGYLSFRTAATTGTLAFSDFGDRTPLATWDLTATTPGVVHGTPGKPVRARISRPSFTVTIAHPRRIGSKHRLVVDPPSSGHYLLLDLRITPVPGATGYLGSVDGESFRFTPTGGNPIRPVTFGVRDALFLETISAGEPLATLLAFDTGKTAGTLAMLDGAGRTVISWRIRPN